MREDNAALDKTVLIEYDGSGNIACKQEFPYTRAEKDALVDDRSKLCWYEYTDGDRLVSFGGERVGGYDPLGNPHLYRGKNLTWTRGSRLDNFDNVRFEYNMAGIRTSKRVDSELTKYFLDGDRILLERTPNRELSYTYGLDGSVTGLTLKDSDGKCVYHFRKNIQGDMTHILDSNGKVVAEYVYDAWGNHKVLDENGEVNDRSDFIGNINPIRYRGYYWDKETGLYYLQSRYYDPEVGRFISADSIEYLDPETINGLNLYAYCGNNPIMNVDPSGHSFTAILIGMLIGAVIGAIASGATNAISQGIRGGAFDWHEFGMSVLGGAVGGAIAGIPIPGFQALGIFGKFLSFGLTFITGASGALVSGAISGSIDFNNRWSVISAIAIGGLANMGGKFIGDVIAKSVAKKAAEKLVTNFAYDIPLKDLVGVGIKGAAPNAFAKFGKEALKLVSYSHGGFAKAWFFGFITSGFSEILAWLMNLR